MAREGRDGQRVRVRAALAHADGRSPRSGNPVHYTPSALPHGTPVATPPNAPSTPPPTPAPTPEPTPLPPQSLGCGLPPVANPAVSCPRTSGSYQDIVTEAIARLAAQSPELFDFDNHRGPLGYFVT